MRSILIILIAFSYINAKGLLQVEWSKVDAQQQKSRRVYPPTLIDKIKLVTLPVYFPKNYIYNKKLSIVADKNFYTITIFLKDASLMIYGDRTYQQKIKSTEQNLKFKMKQIDNKFIRAEGIMSTDFSRHGVNYSLTLECNYPNKDVRCTKDTFLKKVYNQLIIIGGSR